MTSPPEPGVGDFAPGDTVVVTMPGTWNPPNGRFVGTMVGVDPTNPAPHLLIKVHDSDAFVNGRDVSIDLRGVHTVPLRMCRKALNPPHFDTVEEAQAWLDQHSPEQEDV